MANSKGNDRRVEDTDDEDEAPPSTRMETGGEGSAAAHSKKDKGKGRATTDLANGTIASVKREKQENGAADHEEEEDGDTGEAGGEANGEEEDESIDYDNPQDMEDKRDIRRKYRVLTGTLQDDQVRDPDGMTAASLRAGLEQANKLFLGVKAPAEAVLDSTFLMLTSDMAMHQARKIKIGSDYFDTEDFITKLKVNITGGIVPPANGRGSPRKSGAGSRTQTNSDDEADYEGTAVDPYVGWDKIGKLATKHSLRIPPIDFMLGPLAIPQKKKVQKKRQAREKNDVGQKVRPQEIREDDIQHDENNTLTLVKSVADILEAEGGQEGINLFRFIINPESYTQTVENIFYTSFLVKENRAAIDFDKDDQPIIYASLPPDDEQKAEGDLKARQLIFEMDMQTWQDAIAAYDITASVIPTRQYQQVQRGKWYG